MEGVDKKNLIKITLRKKIAERQQSQRDEKRYDDYNKE